MNATAADGVLLYCVAAFICGGIVERALCVDKSNGASS